MPEEKKPNNYYYVMDMEFDTGKCKTVRRSNIEPEILDIVFLKCDSDTDEVAAQFRYKIKPRRPLTNFIKKFLNVTDEMFADGLTYDEFFERASAELGDDLLNGVPVFNAGDEDYYVWRKYVPDYLRQHEDIKTYRECPILLLAHDECITLRNITEVLSLKTLYKGGYLVCGDEDISVRDFSVLYNIDENKSEHDPYADAQQLRKIISFGRGELKKGDYIEIDKLPWADTQGVREVIEKRRKICVDQYAYLTEKYKEWVAGLDIDDINWAAAGIPTDDMGEPLGIGYNDPRDGCLIAAKWSSFAYRKPHTVEKYTAWLSHCAATGKMHYGYEESK